MGRLWLVVCALWWLGCGADVIIEETEATAAEAGGAADGQGASCKLCGAQDCGLCRYEGGDFAFACRSGSPSDTTGHCVQTGSIYQDAEGFYECWRCFSD